MCFRNLHKRVDSAISLFGDKNAGGIVVLKTFAEYYFGYTTSKGEVKQGYADMIAELKQLIQDEKLKEDETRKIVSRVFRDGEFKTSGTEIDRILSPVSRFGGGNRAEKKQRVIDKFKTFFEKYFGI